MDSSAVNAAPRIGIAMLALALYALGLPVPLIAPGEWLMPADRAASNSHRYMPKVATV